MSSNKLRSEIIVLRLKEFLKVKTEAEVADFLGLKQSTFANQKRRNNFDLELIISKCEGIDLNWLLGEEDQKSELKSEISKSGIVIPDTSVTTIPANRVEVLPVRVYDVEVAAGKNGYIATEHAEGEYYLDIAEVEMYTRTLPNRPFAYRISGNSMEPDFFSGELVVVEPFCGSLTDGIYVFRIDDGVLLKQIQRLPNFRVRVISLNTTYEPFEVRLDGSVDIQFIGRVCGKYRRY